jgi:hypothetical protein
MIALTECTANKLRCRFVNSVVRLSLKMKTHTDRKIPTSVEFSLPNERPYQHRAHLRREWYLNQMVAGFCGSANEFGVGLDLGPATAQTGQLQEAGQILARSQLCWSKRRKRLPSP